MRMRGKGNVSGFVLVETAIVCMILSLALVTLVPLYTFCIRANSQTLHSKTAAQLSEELLEEILLRKWDEKTPSSRAAVSTGSTLGIDSTESAADKRTFDDIDDFNGWTENAVLDPLMNPVSGFSGYSRQVTVTYLNATLNPVAGPTDYKQLHVCTSYPRTSPVCLDTFLTNR